MSGGGNLFGALPDDLLNHVLSFLPSREAVQTSLLSRRWRHLWRSVRAVSVRGLAGDDFRLFVSALLLHRDTAASLPPLRSSELDANDLLTPPYDESRDHYYYYYLNDDDDNKPKCHLLCRARSLTVRTKNKFTSWRPRSPLAFASPHLTKFHLEHVHLLDGHLDFSRCPALLQLTLVRCHLEGAAFVSPSLELLIVLNCDIEIRDWDDEGVMRTPTKRVSTPSLRCLELSEDAALFLESESMPWLTDPSIQRTGKTTIYSRKH
ncbi:unnamed protein product [Alopecurus aequalis]